MARQARIEGAGLVHHVTGHSHSWADAFPDESAKRGFLSLLAGLVEELDWHVLAYCLLSSHYHLLVQTQDENLGVGMQRLHGHHTRQLNARLGASGPLWRGRFHSRPARTHEHVVRAAVYIDVNPLVAGVANDPMAWRWSSCSANVGLAEPWHWHRVDRLHGYLAADARDAAGVYRDLVETAVEIHRIRKTSVAGRVVHAG